MSPAASPPVAGRCGRSLDWQSALVLALALALTANAPGAAARSNAASLTELAARADREGRVAEALRLFERAADEAPAARRGEALFNLGLFLHRSGDAARAAAVYESALAANPRLAAAWVKLASLHRDARRWDAAFAALQRALALTPRDASLYLYSGDMLNNLKRWTEACEAYERGLRLEPRAAPLHAHLADSLMNRKLYAEAQRHYERALALEPRNREALAGAWYAALPLAAWGGAWRSREAELVRIAGGPEGPEALPLSAYQALFLPLSPEQRLRVAARRAAEQLRALPLSSAATTQEQRRQERVLVPGEPLRVGYVSRRFERYPGTQLMLRLFGAHDRRVVTVFAYATGPDDGSEERRVVARDADAFRDLSALLDPRDAARVIAADALHVLVDYDGAHDFNNLALLAQRPAPVQVTWLGFPGSSGFPRAVLDFILVDATVAAAASAAFSERLLVLPHSYQPQDERQGWARTPVPTRASEGLPDEGFVFVCFNRLDKVHPNVFAAWMEALRRAPHAVLWLLAEDTEARANVLAAAAEWGVGPERIVFAGRASRDRHLARHALADLFLDTLLYDAHTTASEALWMGVPVLTCPAAPFSSRVAASLLRSLELPELIAPSLRDYVELAVALATGRAWRSAASLRADLLRRRWEPRLSLFKSERFARGALEPALRLAWALRGSNSSVVFVGE